MIRTLFLIAGASFILSVACLSGAAAIGGNDFLRRHWSDNWTVNIHDNDGSSITVSPRGSDAGSSNDNAATTREIAWSGADSLDLDVPADVQFTQGPGPAKLVISGPKGTVDRVTLSGSHLQLSGDDEDAGRLTIAMTAPNVRRFTLSGDESLSIAGLDQDELDLDISGHGSVKAAGRAKATRIDISGDGDVDLGKLAAEDASVEIDGSGRAAIAPTGSADLHISGSGEVNLLTHPANVSSDISGSGRIVQGQPKAAKD